MKTFITILLLFISLGACQTDSKNPNVTTIVRIDVNDTSYTVIETRTVKNGHPVAGTLVGAAVGHYFLGGLGGALIGGAAGNVASDHSTTTITAPETYTKYRVTYYLSDSTIKYRTLDWPPSQSIGDNF